MGIKLAYNEVLIVMPVVSVPGFYASCCPAWRTQWQVSGHFHSGAKQSSLSPRLISHYRENSPEWFPPRFPRRKHAPWRLKWAPASIIGISRAAGSPTCARNKICHRKFWRRSLQCEGLDISRDVLANIETGRAEVKDDFLPFFQRALGVPIVRFFSQEIRDLDANTCRPRRRPFPENPFTQCQQLTNQPRRV